MAKVKFEVLLIKYSRILILLLLFAFFSISTKTFWSPGNWSNVRNIVLQQAPFLIMLSISVMLAIVLKGIDLSVGANISLTSCVTAIILESTQNLFLGIAVGLALGAVVGLINGILISAIKVEPFIATFSMLQISRGLAFVTTGGRQIYKLGPDFRPLFISNEYTLIVIAIVIAIIVSFILRKTNFGRHVYAIGNNIEAARLSGVKTRQVIMTVFVISGTIAALTGLMYIANLGGADPIIGDAFALKAIASALIGGAVMGGGKGKVMNSVVGAFIMLTLTNGMIQIGVSSLWQQFIIGFVIVLSIILERGLQNLNSKLN